MLNMFNGYEYITIPPEVLVTSTRPDLVIHYSDANVIKIIELTVPFETNIEKEHTFKTSMPH